MDLCVEWACLWADHHPTYVCKMEVKKVAVLLCQEWQTSPGWSLKALEELLLIGELIRFDSLLPPLFWHIFTLLLMFPVFMNLALLLHFPVCVFFLPDVVSRAISVTLCVLQNWKKKKRQVEKPRIGMIAHFPCACHTPAETCLTDTLNIYLKYCYTKGLIIVSIQGMSWHFENQKALLK